MDLAEASNQPVELDLAGETYRARCLTLAEWGELQAWYKRAVPSPLERVARALQSAEARGEPVPRWVAEILADQAIGASAVWPPRLGTAEWLRGLDSAEAGVAEFVWHALRRDNPGLTREAAANLSDRAAQPELNALLNVAVFGRPPDPKSPAPTPAAESPAGPSATTGGG